MNYKCNGILSHAMASPPAPLQIGEGEMFSPHPQVAPPQPVLKKINTVAAKAT